MATGQTFSASPSLASPDTLQHAYIVISMWASLWAIGFAIVLAGRWIKGQKAEEGSKKKKAGGKAPVAVSKGDNRASDIREDMAAYIEEVIPIVFRGETSLWKTVVDVFSHHNYVALLWLGNIDLRHVTRVVTVQSMLMFVLAVTYDLQAPSDDGSCSQWLTEEACLLRRSYLDSTQSYCQWGIFSTDDMGTALSGYACYYQDPNPTLTEVLSISVLVSIVTALFLRPVELLFKVLKAPIAYRVRVQPSAPQRKKNQSSNGHPEKDSFEELMKNRHISKIAGVQVREISESTIVARSVARKTLYRYSTTVYGEQKQIDGTPTESGERNRSDGVHTTRGLPFQLSAPGRRNISEDIGFNLTDANFSKTSLEMLMTRSIIRTRQHWGHWSHWGHWGRPLGPLGPQLEPLITGATVVTEPPTGATLTGATITGATGATGATTNNGATYYWSHWGH